VNWNQDSSELPNWDIAEQWMAEQENLYRWNIPQRRIFGINLVFKNGRERAERIGVQEVTGKARRFENFACDYATMLRPEFNKAP